MAKDCFNFKRFAVRQDRCAMKVGTDGTLLGAWARGGSSVLDIGVGTGLVALMMAQRFPEASIVGIDIDSEAVGQARENVLNSPFRNIEVLQADARSYAGLPKMGLGNSGVHQHQGFQAIVCNPPFFSHSMTCPETRRTVARHTVSLSFHDLFLAVKRLLAEEGEFSVVIPFDYKVRLEEESALVGLFKVRECAVKTTPRKPTRRYLMAFRRHPDNLVRTEGVIEVSPNVRSEWYQELTKDFYL